MMKSNKGIALATLIIAVIVMLIITGTIAYTSLDTMKLRKLDDMYSDIRLLNQKVANYYIQNNELPVLDDITISYDSIEDVVTEDQEDGTKKRINENDSDNYYIIDLEKLGGVTLKYGKDYNYYKENIEYNEEKKDIYIINSKSHTIYYLKGIKIELEGMDGTKYSLEKTYSKVPLPSRVEYVGITGTQYIDTEIVATSDVTAIIEYKFSVSTNAFKVPFGVMKTNSSFVAGITNTNYLTKRYGKDSSWVLSTLLASVNTRYSLKLNSTGLYVNEELLLENTETTFNSGLNIYLGMINNNGNALSAYSAGGMKIYSFKLYEGEKLVRDFIPYRTADNVIGFYDLVENKFYENKGTGNFTAGKLEENLLPTSTPTPTPTTTPTPTPTPTSTPTSSVLPDEYQALEYIKFTGTQKIDTNYIPNNNTKIEISFMAKVSGRGIYASDSGSSLTTNFTGYASTAGNFRFGNKTVARQLLIDTQYVIEQSKDGLIINDSLAGNYDGYNEFTSTNNLVLGYNTNYFEGNIYYVKLYEDDVLERDMVPCYRKSDNIAGMYDLVNDVFYTNAGTGEFVVGNDVDS